MPPPVFLNKKMHRHPPFLGGSGAQKTTQKRKANAGTKPASQKSLRSADQHIVKRPMYGKTKSKLAKYRPAHSKKPTYGKTKSKTSNYPSKFSCSCNYHTTKIEKIKYFFNFFWFFCLCKQQTFYTGLEDR